MSLKIQKNIKLSKYNTFMTGGDARFFCEVKNENELLEAIDFAEKNKIKFFVIGNGSNLLIEDKKFNCLFIKISIKGNKIEKINKINTIVSSYAGEDFDNLIKFSIKNNLSGVENLWKIPGTVGASLVQNIGAYGVEVKDFVYKVECFDFKKKKKIILNSKECLFDYRDSIFKKNKKIIIIKVYFKLNNNFKPNLSYSVIKNFFKNKEKVEIKEIIKFIEKIRKEKLPDWKKVGTAGSFFKNPILTSKRYSELVEKYPDLPMFKFKKDLVKIPLAFVLDKICNLKGYRINNVGLYDKQPLVVVNYGRATFSEIDLFAKKIEKKVFKKIKIKIEREVEKIS